MPQHRPKNELNNKTVQFWRSQIESAEKWSQTFRTRGSKIVERYRDADRLNDDRTGGSFAYRYNILYSNTDTMLPVLYSEIPKPDGRATNPRDLAARHAAKMMEGVLEYSIESNDFNYMMEKVVKDLLLPGLGVARVKVDTAFSQEEVEEEVETEDGVEVEIKEEDRVALQSTSVEYVNWDDFIFPETVSWDDLPWMAFRGRQTLDEATDMFGSENANLLEYTTNDEDDKTNKRHKSDDDTSDSFKKATIYEIWDKEKRERLFVSKGGLIKQPLEIDDDPLELQGFFPTPRPLLSITTNDTTLPVPLFMLYQDQADELDIITARITGLVNQLRKRGVYDAAIKELNNFSKAGDNSYVPVEDFARFQDKGGLSTVWQSEDIKPYAEVLVSLYQQRDQILNIIFQIVGISDIQRAVTDPRETAAAQRIKSRYGSLRISRMQRDIQRFIRDLMRLQSELVINTFSPEVISTITGMPLDSTVEPQFIKNPQGQSVPNPEAGKVTEFGVKDLLEKLKNQEPPSIVVDIETDSTLAKDDQADKERVVEFNTIMGTYAAAAPAMQGTLGTDVTAELGLSIVRQFKMGRNIEQAFQDRIDDIKSKEGQPQPPSPEETEAETNRLELIEKGKQDNIQNQIDVAKLQQKDRELELKAAELGLKDDKEQQKIDLEGINTAIKVQDQELDERKLALEAINPNKNIVAEG